MCAVRPVPDSSASDAKFEAIVHDCGVLLMWLAMFLLLYLIDIILVAASSLLILRGLQHNVDLILANVVQGFKHAFPGVLHWYLHAVQSIFAWINSVATMLDFVRILSKSLQVTCMGAQAPSEALLDVGVGLALFLVFASGILVVSHNRCPLYCSYPR
jgi:hypothetical protein